MAPTIPPSSNPRKCENLLRRKLLCTLKDNQLNVDYKLSTSEASGRSEVPHHYIFVMDVSGSMNFKMHEEGARMIDRVKVFAELLVGNINHNDFLSIVTFNVNTTVCLKKTKMSEEGKKLALEAITSVKAEGGTNLQKGLQKGLEIANSFDDPTRDLIMLFTDGEATYGEKSSKKLVAEYKRLMSVTQRNHRVPLSAMSIGDYKPKLLCEISRRLGSDAFYWLKEDSDFEADMFTPVFLRNSTQITDIETTLSDLHEDVTFEKFTTEYLEEKMFLQNEEEVPTERKTSAIFQTMKAISSVLIGLLSDYMEEEEEVEEEHGDIVGLRYFIHGMPNSMTKTISFSLKLPENFEDKMNDTVVLKIKTTYLDHEMKVQSLEDDLVIYSKKMHRTLLDDAPTAEIARYNSEEAQKVFRETTAYTLENNEVGKSWENAKEAYVGIELQECRLKTMNAFLTASQNLENDSFDWKRLIEISKEVCDTLSKTVSLLFGEKDPYAEYTQREAEAFKAQIKAMERLLSKDDKSKWIRLVSGEISLGKEMPTTSTTLDLEKNERQLFMPENIGDQLDEIKKNVQGRPYRGYAYGYKSTP